MITSTNVCCSNSKHPIPTEKRNPKSHKTPLNLWEPFCTQCTPGGEGVVVDPPASPQGSGNNGWFGHQVHCAQITHSLVASKVKSDKKLISSNQSKIRAINNCVATQTFLSSQPSMSALSK